MILSWRLRPSLLRTHTTSRSITNNSSTIPDGYRLPTPPQQRDKEPLPVELEFSPDLPLSPLVEYPELFRKRKIPYSKRHPKLRPIPGPHRALSAQSAALKFNPFANILASPVRNAVPHQLRIPSFLLLKFSILRQPVRASETEKSETLSSPHPSPQRSLLLPINILPSTINRQTTVRGSYAACRRTVLESFMKKSGWKRLVPRDDCPGISKLEWRRDTPAYTGRGIQKRLVWEFERMMKVLRHGAVVEGSGADGRKVGCLLVWPGEEQVVQQRIPGYVGPVQTLPDGSTVPVHDIPWMFPGTDGSMSAEEVKKLLCLDSNTKQAAILLHHQTYKAQMWLVKLRYYLS